MRVAYRDFNESKYSMNVHYRFPTSRYEIRTKYNLCVNTVQLFSFAIDFAFVIDFIWRRTTERS